jgi:hypothetical protein
MRVGSGYHDSRYEPHGLRKGRRAQDAIAMKAGSGSQDMTKHPKEGGWVLGECSKVAHEKLQHARRKTRRMSETSDEMSGGNKTEKKIEGSKLGARWKRPNNIII